MCDHNENCPYNQWNTEKMNKLIPWFSMVDSIKGKSARTILETNRSVEHDCDKHSSGCLRHQKASARFWRSKDCRHRNGCIFISLLEGGYSISNWYFVNVNVQRSLLLRIGWSQMMRGERHQDKRHPARKKSVFQTDDLVSHCLCTFTPLPLDYPPSTAHSILADFDHPACAPPTVGACSCQWQDIGRAWESCLKPQPGCSKPDTGAGDMGAGPGLAHGLELLACNAASLSYNKKT